jgi:FKBP-type peptidyl-prolyl cis-trans isomerase FkpA
MNRPARNWKPGRPGKKKSRVQHKAFKHGLYITDIPEKLYKMRSSIAALLVIITFFVSCYKNNVNTTTCDYDPCAVKATALEISAIESYLAGAGITTATRHCSGMYYEIMSPGTGDAPTICSYVSVNYKGTLTNGTVVDQTTTAPAGLNLISLIEGWKNGILLLKKAGKIRLYIPPSLGYGAQQTGNVPPNSILIFDIELVDVQ